MIKNKLTQESLVATVSETDNAFPNGEIEHSYAFMKEGRLVVRHPPEGPYPLVMPCPGVRLIVNGKECTKLMPVSRQDAVSVEAVDERIEGDWSISVSADGLQVKLRVRPAVVLGRELADLPPAGKLQLAVIEVEEFFPPLTWDELLEELSRQGINYGVDWQACSRGVALCTEEEVVVARGVPAKPGKDSRVEFLFSNESKVSVPVEEKETVDFRERYIFTSVEAGEVLAVKSPPEPGYPGTSVKGTIIMPPSPSDCILVAGDGAVLDKDGLRVVAARFGRPKATRCHNSVRVSVLPELLHIGDVELVSGNISFKGDVVVTGNVEEGMKVEAGGNIRVGGLVSGARIQAAESVLIRGNILTSVVIAGKTPAYMEDILTQVRVLATGLQEIILAIHQLLDHPSFKQGDFKYEIGSLLKLLLEGKYNHLPVVVKALRKQVKNFPPGIISDDLIRFINRVERVVLHPPLVVHDLQEVVKLSHRASEWEQALVVSPFFAQSNVIAANIINSTVIASGEIKVLGGGCYNSQIQADKKVTITGVFRGGEIQAGGDVYIGELGSRSGSATRLLAGAGARVTVNLAYENALILVGPKVYRLDRNKKNVCLWLDKEGNLQFRANPI